jgi:hypothetical protein
MIQEERMKMFRQADGMLVEETSLLPLCYGRFHMLLKPRGQKTPHLAPYVVVLERCHPRTALGT